ncbi:YciI family protein [Micromonospora sp. WMMD1120]|uniref:YciI family protein n=1 Tax=Micromonospora sp. WMMD1120 TaxID=3016106 RepID=UPI0024159D8F|nr:YciI family protein [Micromonospora sp. WMMD1120]MDG4810374.1 YciI family protein [Micromonospora sp. WMMD1120]
MTQYLLSIQHPPQGGPPPAPDFLADVMRQLGELRDELASTGSWVFGQGLHGPETATVLRVRDGEVLVTDGPFAEGKEYLGGITIIDVPDLDAALDWGRRYALATTLPIEVRPFHDGSGD